MSTADATTKHSACLHHNRRNALPIRHVMLFAESDFNIVHKQQTVLNTKSSAIMSECIIVANSKLFTLPSAILSIPVSSRVTRWQREVYEWMFSLFEVQRWSEWDRSRGRSISQRLYTRGYRILFLENSTVVVNRYSKLCWRSIDYGVFAF